MQKTLTFLGFQFSKIIVVGMGVYRIHSEPWYDNCNQCYYNTLTIDKKPNGVLGDYVRRVQRPKLSPFQVNDYCCPETQCPFVIYKDFSDRAPICEQDYNWLLEFLIENAYTIDYQLTKMINNSELRNKSKRLLCFVKD